MKVHIRRRRCQISWGGMSLHVLELMFLLFGLIAVDVYVWINASSMLNQAYDDWAFDQRLRALKPSPLRFAADEFRSIFGGNRAELPKPEPLQPPGPPPLVAPTPTGVIGRLEIPTLHLSAMVREGADAATLRRAVGHIPGTALPGGIGNVGLAGHRDTFFRPLRNIQKHDAIELETQAGTYEYEVESTRIVGPREIGVLASTSTRTLTLVTCYPFYYVGSAPKRFIVRAALR